MPTVSAVVPTHNRAGRVGGAVESVLDQTYDDLEVVVVDDGSTDDTRDVLATYAAHDRVRVLHAETNRGISAARNRGIEAARGEYVCALDDDDRWHPRKVERQVEAMARLDDRYCGCYTGGRILDPDGELVRTVQRGAAGDLYPEILAENVVVPHSSHLVRRDCLDAVGGYDTAFPRAVDWDLAIRLAREYRIAYLPELLVDRHFHGGNVSGDAAFGDPSYQVSVRERLREKYSADLAANPGVRARFEAELAKHRGVAALESGDRRLAVEQLLRAVRLDPGVERAVMAGLAALGPDAYRTGWRLKRALG